MITNFCLLDLSSHCLNTTAIVLASLTAIITTVAITALFVPAMSVFLIGSATFAMVSSTIFLVTLIAAIGLICFNKPSLTIEEQIASPPVLETDPVPLCYQEICKYPELLAVIEYFRRSIHTINQLKSSDEEIILDNRQIPIKSAMKVSRSKNEMKIVFHFETDPAKAVNRHVTIECSAGLEEGFEVDKVTTNHQPNQVLRRILRLLISSAQAHEGVTWIRVIKGPTPTDQLLYLGPSDPDSVDQTLKKLPSILTAP